MNKVALEIQYLCDGDQEYIANTYYGTEKDILDYISRKAVKENNSESVREKEITLADVEVKLQFDNGRVKRYIVVGGIVAYYIRFYDAVPIKEEK